MPGGFLWTPLLLGVMGYTDPSYDRANSTNKRVGTVNGVRTRMVTPNPSSPSGANPGTSSPLSSRRLELGDGRRLGYVEYGDPTGRPVLLFPGVPGSRLQGHPDRSIAAALGARLIAIDRPGYGLSDVQPGRTILDWPDDVAALADHLGIERFAVLSISGGGPYAAACAWKIPQRVTTVALVSPIGPPNDEEALARMPRLNRILLALAKWGERPVSLPAAALLALARRRLDWYLAVLNAHLPRADRLVYERPDVYAALREDMAEAIRPGSQGAVRDLVLLARPWGFRLAEIKVPVQLWHGEQDATVPVEVGRALAGALPRCRAQFVSGAGHFLVLDRWRQILAELLRADLAVANN